MGKSLIIKGADFSLNSLWSNAIIAQGFLVTNPNSDTYGRIYTSDLNSRNCIMTKVFISSGATMAVKVTDSGVPISDLLISYIASSNNIPLTDALVLQGIVDNLYPPTSSIRGVDGTFYIENTTNSDLYYYLVLCYSVQSGPAISVIGKEVLYQRVMTD